MSCAGPAAAAPTPCPAAGPGSCRPRAAVAQGRGSPRSRRTGSAAGSPPPWGGAHRASGTFCAMQNRKKRPRQGDAAYAQYAVCHVPITGGALHTYRTPCTARIQVARDPGKHWEPRFHEMAGNQAEPPTIPLPGSGKQPHLYTDCGSSDAVGSSSSSTAGLSAMAIASITRCACPPCPAAPVRAQQH